MNNALYTEIILDHNRSSDYKYIIENPDKTEHGHNPSCGDDLTLYVKLEDKLIKEASFSGTGCAISTASMSIMISLVLGESIIDAHKKCYLFLGMIKGKKLTDDEKELLGDAIAFEGLSKMPARVKCGTLGWHCLKVILDE